MKSLFFVWMFCSLFLFSCKGNDLSDIQVGGHPLKVEIARTAAQRSIGLMHRSSLPDDQGMLFIFHRSRNLFFWMKDTLIPLSIAFITADGTIKQIEDMNPQSLEAVSSRNKVLYALEVNRGWFRKKGIKPGDKVQLPDNLPSGE